MPTIWVQVHLMKSIFQVKDRPQSVFRLFANQVLDQGQWKWIIFCLEVQVSVVDYHSPLLSAVLLCRLGDNKSLGSPFALRGMTGQQMPGGETRVDVSTQGRARCLPPCHSGSSPGCCPFGRKVGKCTRHLDSNLAGMHLDAL